ncbi:CIS tube protein [Deinococcus cellulosilyticus]|uniref:Contractile injection system tube protein N-terminal domain-containing protein n=1 Tax=Deinococcus cellulosilyticus (strain DSM 18568 / NBRC 106333 / KACC 11606 / 5516J-15) TaxID=1223518 RepID=A0A511MZJ5_DEIC1|nr:hypothetical protein [Deinococcus cellulosilyticus]GEM46013.1 hypothetical protein DC3_16480 [Deinococcus cellulosilyticus NBRC 106333 = KACC 11606]
MPELQQLARAYMIELDAQSHEKPDTRIEVQFNPETLKVTFANQVANQDQGGKQNSPQFVGKGSTKLALTLYFDVTGELSTSLDSTAQGKGEPNSGTRDVRRLTRKVAHFITPQEIKEGKDRGKFAPPKVRFHWGSFQFDGIMESLEENLDFFSHDGFPLRASLTVGLTQQEIQFQIASNPAGAGQAKPGGKPAGTTPQTPARKGGNLPQMADQQGMGDDWQSVARGNNIENPRQLKPGQLIDFSLRKQVDG